LLKRVGYSFFGRIGQGRKLEDELSGDFMCSGTIAANPGRAGQMVLFVGMLSGYSVSNVYLEEFATFSTCSIYVKTDLTLYRGIYTRPGVRGIMPNII
jgi:hypothetical protein